MRGLRGGVVEGLRDEVRRPLVNGEVGSRERVGKSGNERVIRVFDVMTVDVA